MSSTTIISKPHRRWLQFSLRGMLVLTASIGVLLGWAMHLVRAQWNAVTALEQIGCTIQYSHADEASIPERFGNLTGLDAFREVQAVYCGPAMTDAGLVHLRGLPKLRQLGLTHTQVTDAGLAQLEKLPELRILFVSETQVTDAGLVHLRRLKKLQAIGLYGNKITDAGLVHLRGLYELRWLNLGGTQVSDPGVLGLRQESFWLTVDY
jgi:hypothetical protein